MNNYLEIIPKRIFILSSILSSAFWITLYSLYLAYREHNFVLSNWIGISLSFCFYTIIIGAISLVFMWLKKIKIHSFYLFFFIANVVFSLVVVLFDPFGIFSFMLD
jgi:hypothetical protein